MAPTGLNGNQSGGQSGAPEGALTFEADLRKRPGTKLGIDVVLVSSPHGCGLVVERVNEGGLVEAWNRRNRDPLRIRAGDFIVRVNGIEGEISALAKELRSGADVRITVQRSGAEDAPQTWKDMQASIMRKRPGAVGSTGPGTMEPSVSSAPASFAGPIGLPDEQTKWGPGFQYNGQGSEPSWGAGQWPHNSWDASDNLDSRMPPNSRLAIAVDSNQMVDESCAYVAPHANLQHVPENSFTFEVSLTKPNRARLGIDVMPHTVTDFCGLEVKRVSKGGVVEEWNSQCRDPRAQIIRGDRIVRVNGITTDFAQMWEELCTRRELNVTVLRCSDQATSFSQGQAAFGVGPVTLPGHGGRNMLENAMRPAIADAVSLSRGSGVGSGPPTIFPPNHITLGRDATGSHRVGPVSSSQGLGRAGNPSGAPSNLVSAPGGASTGILGGFGVPGAPGPTAPGGHGLGKGSSNGKGMPMPSFDGPENRASPPVAPVSPSPPIPSGLPSGPGNHSLIAGPSAANLGEDVIRFDVILETAKNKRVGMDVILVSGSQLCGFVVERVSEGGRVDTWNKQSQPPYRVQAGDYIVQVNGIGNWQSLSKMAEEFVKESRQVCFTIQRGPSVLMQGQNQNQTQNQSARKSTEKPAKDGKKQDVADAKAPPVSVGSSLVTNEITNASTSPDVAPPLPLGLGWKSTPSPTSGEIPVSTLAQARKEMPSSLPRQSTLAQELQQEVCAVSHDTKSSLAAAIANISCANNEDGTSLEPQAQSLPLEMPPSPCSEQSNPQKEVEPPPGPPPGLSLPALVGKVALGSDKDEEEHTPPKLAIASSHPSASASPPPEAPPAPPQSSLHMSVEAVTKVSELPPAFAAFPLLAESTLGNSELANSETDTRSSDVQSPSSADRELDTNRDMPANGRRNNKASVTPIGAGRTVGRASDGKAPAVTADTNAGPEANLHNGNGGSDAEKTNKAVQQLRTKTLQLSDKDVSCLLRSVLSQRPGLRDSVSQSFKLASSTS